MSIIKLPLLFEGSLGEKTLYALFDSGATFSCISMDAIANLEEKVKMRHPIEVATASEGIYLRPDRRESMSSFNKKKQYE